MVFNDLIGAVSFVCKLSVYTFFVDYTILQNKAILYVMTIKSTLFFILRNYINNQTSLIETPLFHYL